MNRYGIVLNLIRGAFFGGVLVSVYFDGEITAFTWVLVGINLVFTLRDLVVGE